MINKLESEHNKKGDFDLENKDFLTQNNLELEYEGFDYEEVTVTRKNGKCNIY